VDGSTLEAELKGTEQSDGKKLRLSYRLEIKGGSNPYKAPSKFDNGTGVILEAGKHDGGTLVVVFSCTAPQ
jgi:hypothetical protein